jgi:hypothetical protein
MSMLLQQEVADYHARRTVLADAISDYADWMDRLHGIDIERTLHLNDTAASLKKDRLLVAFVAEFSRGKTELINALFFADHGQRLLPSDVGRTTMCPVELFSDADEAPCLKLLPIETRTRTESLGHLRHMPVEWSRVQLDPKDTKQVQKSLRKLTETKLVPATQAMELGLWDKDDASDRARLQSDGKVEIPVWRYALLNFPHPLLQAGLTILDTPGLNALGAEPELTLSVIPGAHAVIFVLATDTGVTRSDLEIWQKHVHRHTNYHIAVLNKVDMLWDELKSESEIRASIERQAAETARVLKLPASQVFAVSAQKALTAKILNDPELRLRSGIDGLEYLLAHQIIPARQDILCHAVNHEVLGMLGESRTLLSSRVRRSSEELIQLSQLSGKNRELVAQAKARLQAEKTLYDATADRFKQTRKVMQGQGEVLISQLSEDTLNAILEEARASMEESWTTHGLTSSIHALSERMTERFKQAALHADNLLDSLDQAYDVFHRQHALPKMQVPRLDLTAYLNRLQTLMNETDLFCRDPANIMLEKRFMIRRFYAGLVDQARKTFALARTESERWLRISLDPVMTRIREHKQNLDTRLTSLKNILENMGTLQHRMEQLKTEIAGMRNDRVLLDEIGVRLSS